MRFYQLAKQLNNPAVGLDLLRTYLGIVLLVRGGMFIARPDALTSFMERGQWFMAVTIAHYVVAAHVAGGILLILGLCTRVAALLQVPVLLGAVFFVHWGEGLLSGGQSLELSALVCMMLLVIGVCGPGKFSLDHLLAKDDAVPTVLAGPSSSPPVEHAAEAAAHS